ncbi:MAG: YHYH protein [Ilumatobacter sp.]
MMNHSPTRTSAMTRFAALSCGALLFTSACASSDSAVTEDPTEPDVSAASDTTVEPDTTTADTTATTDVAPADTIANTTTDTAAVIETATSESEAEPGSDTVEAASSCDDIAAQFVTRGSANPDLDDPEVEATCDGGNVIVDGNAIPDYTYIETSPGQPRDRDQLFSFPSSPTVADEVTAIPYIGTAGVTLGGIPIFGPTEGTGGDVESLPGILSDCGSHNGPSGFHIHLILTSSETDCLFTPEEVAAAPQLVGYAFDGFPIYTGIDQYTSSWELTDESLFATDTWEAHSYVEGSGDLDECNGLTDEEGNYAYYTTSTFPYILGCYTGVVDLDASGGGGGGGDEEGDDADRPERPEGDAAAEGDADRPERPEGDAAAEGEDRPERLEGGAEPPADGDE